MPTRRRSPACSTRRGAWRRPARALPSRSATPGRKASCQRPWEGGKPLTPGEDAWPTVAPSAVPFTPDGPPPQALDAKGLARVTAAFCQAAERAVRLGFDAIELHGAHGYLLHAFVSPLSNQRKDAYGGSAENRMRFPLEVARAVRAVVPQAGGARRAHHRHRLGGRRAHRATMRWRSPPRSRAPASDYVCVSGGGAVPNVKIALGPGYQVPFAAKVKAATGLATRAVGLIVTPEQAEAIVASGQADCVALARAFLDDPRWVWHAAERLGAEISIPPPYARTSRAAWPGAAIVRPMPPR